MQRQKEKEKVKNKMQKYEKKAKEAKKYTQALRKVNYAYTKKNGLSSILEEF